jgi:hypothetical protein
VTESLARGPQGSIEGVCFGRRLSPAAAMQQHRKRRRHDDPCVAGVNALRTRPAWMLLAWYCCGILPVLVETASSGGLSRSSLSVAPHGWLPRRIWGGTKAGRADKCQQRALQAMRGGSSNDHLDWLVVSLVRLPDPHDERGTPIVTMMVPRSVSHQSGETLLAWTYGLSNVSADDTLAGLWQATALLSDVVVVILPEAALLQSSDNQNTTILPRLKYVLDQVQAGLSRRKKRFKQQKQKPASGKIVVWLQDSQHASVFGTVHDILTSARTIAREASDDDVPKKKKRVPVIFAVVRHLHEIPALLLSKKKRAGIVSMLAASSPHLPAEMAAVWPLVWRGAWERLSKQDNNQVVFAESSPAEKQELWSAWIGARDAAHETTVPRSVEELPATPLNVVEEPEQWPVLLDEPVVPLPATATPAEESLATALNVVEEPEQLLEELDQEPDLGSSLENDDDAVPLPKVEESPATTLGGNNLEQPEQLLEESVLDQEPDFGPAPGLGTGEDAVPLPANVEESPATTLESNNAEEPEQLLEDSISDHEPDFDQAWENPSDDAMDTSSESVEEERRDHADTVAAMDDNLDDDIGEALDNMEGRERDQLEVVDGSEDSHDDVMELDDENVVASDLDSTPFESNEALDVEEGREADDDSNAFVEEEGLEDDDNDMAEEQLVDDELQTPLESSIDQDEQRDPVTHENQHDDLVMSIEDEDGVEDGAELQTPPESSPDPGEQLDPTPDENVYVESSQDPGEQLDPTPDENEYVESSPDPGEQLDPTPDEREYDDSIDEDNEPELNPYPPSTAAGDDARVAATKDEEPENGPIVDDESNEQPVVSLEDGYESDHDGETGENKIDDDEDAIDANEVRQEMSIENGIESDRVDDKFAAEYGEKGVDTTVPAIAVPSTQVTGVDGAREAGDATSVPTTIVADDSETEEDPEETNEHESIFDKAIFDEEGSAGAADLPEQREPLLPVEEREAPRTQSDEESEQSSATSITFEDSETVDEAPSLIQAPTGDDTATGEMVETEHNVEDGRDESTSSDSPPTIAGAAQSVSDEEAVNFVLRELERGLDDLQTLQEEASLRTTAGPGVAAVGDGKIRPPNDLHFGQFADELLLNSMNMMKEVPVHLQPMVRKPLVRRLRELYDQHLQSLRDYYGQAFESMLDESVAEFGIVGEEGEEKDMAASWRALREKWKKAASLVTQSFEAAANSSAPTVIIDNEPNLWDYSQSLQGLLSDMVSATDSRRPLEDSLFADDDETDTAASGNSSRRFNRAARWYEKLAARALVLGVNYLQGWLALQAVRRAAAERDRRMPKFPLF